MAMTSEVAEGTGLPARLHAFLAADQPADTPAEPGRRPFIAERALFVTEPPRAQARSRLVGAGGVRFIRAESYRLTVADLAAMAGRREGISQVWLQLVKFYFTFTELPPDRSYAEIRVRIAMDPHVPVLQLRPFLRQADSELTHSFSTEFSPALGKMLQFMKRSTAESTSRTEHQPVITALDLGMTGFGWTYQAAVGAPLFPRTEYNIAVLEVPAGTRQLAGTFDAEAIVTRKVLRTFSASEALATDPPVPFTIPVSAGPR
jgi:hypothetical protein